MSLVSGSQSGPDERRLIFLLCASANGGSVSGVYSTFVIRQLA